MADVMVVDDNPDVVRVVKGILEAAGHDVIGASGGEEALERLKYIRPQLILLDIMMPELDGWQTLRLIRKKEGFSDVPVSMLTAKTLSLDIMCQEDIEELVDYIQKPFSKDGLIKRVNKILKSSDQRASKKDRHISGLEDSVSKKFSKRIKRLQKLHEGMLRTLKANLEETSANLEETSNPTDSAMIKEAIEYQKITIKTLENKKSEIDGL
jgi:CheY-like chemotaxis protein